MNFRCSAAFAAILLPAIGCGGEPPAPEDPPPLEDPDDRVSYSLGHQIGTDLEHQGRKIDAEALLRGLRDGLAGADPSVPTEEMDTLLLDVKQRIEASATERKQQKASERRARGDAFLSANLSQEGVVALPSGLQYRVLQPGTGSRPSRADRVSVHYRSTLIDGTVFHDSRQSGGEPETIHVSGVIRGLSEALQLMQVGARWQLFIPPDLAYGRRGPLADRTVVYEVELLSIEPGE